ncbi:MAG: PglZ domain-containing protein, partial [Alistipes sp.]|nr:PglZ domain-containing protein [Alistipes sp.]
DNEEGGKNQHEEEFLRRLMQTKGKSYALSFDKIVKSDSGKRLVENLDKVYQADFSVIIYNFLDILSHARTETQIIRDLAEDEAAFRSLTRSWFEHSDLLEVMRLLSERGHTIIITSDHGTIQVDHPIKVHGDRETSTNLRYKTGRNLGFNNKEVFAITKPEAAHLPKSNLTSTYIFAYNRDFFVYPNNTNQFIRYYNNTFQHGGISMEEMIVPFLVLTPKR